MALNVLFIFCLLLNVLAEADQVCDIANVQIENEDGSRQVFELKRLLPQKDSPCLLCSGNDPGIRTWEITPLSFNVVLSQGELINECENENHNLPAGLCLQKPGEEYCTKGDKDVPQCLFHDPQVMAEEIVARNLVPMATGNTVINNKLALGIVHLNTGSFDKAIAIFTNILNQKPKTTAAYYGRGVAYSRKGLNTAENAIQALADFTQAIQKDKTQPDSYERRAEVYTSLGEYQEAYNDLTTAIQKRPTEKTYFMRGVLGLLLEDFGLAEEDFRRNLESEGELHIMSYFHLGVALYYRGRVRNAIEVFKEVLKLRPDHIDACTSLAQAFRELGNLKAASTRFNQSFSMDSNHVLTRQLHGSMLYSNGQPKQALQEFTKCIELAENNINCQYMQSLSYMAVGQFYQGVKASAKVLIKNTTPIKMSPEFMKAHYLKEYGRYIHSKLDSPLKYFTPEKDFDSEFREQWVKILPFKFKTTYKEQPGLQPEISDVKEHTLTDYSEDVRKLICQAEKLGSITQVKADGFTPNRRLNLAMGIATIHIAQYLETKWKNFKNSKERLSWKELYRIAVQYRRLVDPEQPVFWVDTLPEHNTPDGIRSDVNFVRGSVVNLRVMQYFDLVFKLAKTMLEHYTGEEAIIYPGLHEDVNNAKTCEDLLMVARKRQINPHGFLVSTQVPSTAKSKEDKRLDGSVLVLSRDLFMPIEF
ncbi:tetratricopeptide repeat protein 13 isoform X2 [Patella vulgata]|uniref:tetratricopeptide repeat protein 13 isoform X2 n=1 Tax=Patella vulgata TaxID=6465 RepID=UPI00217FF109|nr:tetratricopeptide repeat protein 13 isoform X2 [Patella vulgata]